MRWAILFLMVGCGNGGSVIRDINDFKYEVGDLVHVQLNNIKCRGYVASYFNTGENHYRITSIICDGKKFYDVWVPEYDISR